MSMEAETTESASCRLREVTPAAVADGGVSGVPVGRIRHFDQLDHGDQRAFLRMLRDEPATVTFPVGTVIVFTGYYLVERA